MVRDLLLECRERLHDAGKCYIRLKRAGELDGAAMLSLRDALRDASECVGVALGELEPRGGVDDIDADEIAEMVREARGYGE